MKIKKILKFFSQNMIGFILGLIVFGIISVSAADSFILDSAEVEYNNALSGAAATTVKQALDYLNNKADTLLAEQGNNNNDGNNHEDGVYSVGDTVTFKGDSYHVLDDSGSDQDYITLLKDEPLTVTEIEALGLEAYYNWEEEGASADWAGVMYDDDYSSDYASSSIKNYVDTWAADKFTSTDLKEVEGYKARLVQKEELRSQFYPSCSESASTCYSESTTPSWLYAPNEEYWYWTMTQWNDSSSNVWDVHTDGGLYSYYVYDGSGAVRPVINLYKSALNS